MSASHRPRRTPLWFIAVTSLLAGFGATETQTLQQAAGPPTLPTLPRDETMLYAAVLTPLNETMTERPVTGRATFIIDEREGTVRTTLTAENLSPGTHAAYFHGSTDRLATSCPTGNADGDGNGVVDAAELLPYAGRPLIPLNERLEHKAPFPAITAEGDVLIQRGTKTLVELRSDFQAAYGDLPIEIEKGVVIVYGAPLDKAIPQDMILLEGMTAAGSVPVACGEVTRVG